MVTIEIDVDENILADAEKALHDIGMDVQIAVNVFLRRVAIEKGLPMLMTASASSQKSATATVGSQELPQEETMFQTRSNNTITKDMVDEVWRAFTKYHKGLGEISRLSDEVAENSGMNRGSAFIYLNILVNLVKGESNTRTLKMKDLEFLMGKIKSDLGENLYQKAIYSLRQSIPYWQVKLPGAFADKVMAYCDSHDADTKR